MEGPYSERTVVILKPDALERGLEPEIMKRFILRGLAIPAFYTARLTREMAADYILNVRKPIGNPEGKRLEERIDYLTCGPVMPILLEGTNAIRAADRMVGTKDEPLADPRGTIRGDLSSDSVELAERRNEAVRNVIDVSRSPEAVSKYIDFWFNKLISGNYSSAFALPPANTDERTVVLLKPEVHKHRFEHWVLERLHQVGVKVPSMYKTKIDFEFAKMHYADLYSRKPEVAPSVCKYLSSGPITAMVIEGRNAILGIRGICGEKSDPPANPFGTIRRDFSIDSIALATAEGRLSVENVVHSSDSPEAAAREIDLWFNYGLRDHTAEMLRPISR